MMDKIDVIAKRLFGEEFTAKAQGEVKVGELHKVEAHDENGVPFAVFAEIVEIL